MGSPNHHRRGLLDTSSHRKRDTHGSHRRVVHAQAVPQHQFCCLCPRMQQRTRSHLWRIFRGNEGSECIQRQAAGLMAIHLILLSINKLNRQLSGSVEIVSDCLGALKRVTFLPLHRIPSRCRHLDILKTILVHCCELSFTTYYSHIKAHQDDNASFKKLSRKAQLNCICNHAAKQ
jgi:hypothetical protein